VSFIRTSGLRKPRDLTDWRQRAQIGRCRHAATGTASRSCETFAVLIAVSFSKRYKAAVGDWG
jgi:hypothetical protein